MRPIILPDDSLISIQVISPNATYMVAADGQGRTFEDSDVLITVSKSPERIRFVKLNHWHYFDTLRKKLAWGAGG
jgi:NAD+ kinase